MDKKNIKFKVVLYISSLTILFVLIAILAADYSKLYSIHNLNAFIAVCFAGFSWWLNIRMENDCRGSMNDPVKLKTITREDYEYLSFLTTYIIPLACLDFQQPQYFDMLVLLLVIIGAIYIRTGQYYANPILAIWGYRIYRVEIDDNKNRGEIILISKDLLTNQSEIRWISIDENVWFAKEAKS